MISNKSLCAYLEVSGRNELTSSFDQTLCLHEVDLREVMAEGWCGGGTGEREGILNK